MIKVEAESQKNLALSAEETCLIQSTMEDIREFCNEMANSFNSIEDLLKRATQLKELVNTVSDNMCDLAARTEEITAATDTVNEISQNVRSAIEGLTD